MRSVHLTPKGSAAYLQFASFLRLFASSAPCAALATVAATVAHAQGLTGVVRDARSSQPVAGAVVSILGTSGTSIRQTITDRVGAFRLDVDTGGRRAQVRRIGYLPWEGPLPDSAGRLGAMLDVKLQPIPATLEPMKSTAVKCRPARGEGQALALFEQARFGLQASVVARQANPAQFAVARFHQQGTSDKEMLQTLAVVGGASNRPFVASLSPAALISSGFVSRTAAGRVFHGIDSDLLLSEAFAATHCFDLASANGNHRGQIGIAFTPALDRGVAEVSGTIWLDQSPLMLRSLEFRYTNVPAADRSAGAGGTVTFRTMENGVVITDEWQTRVLSGAFESVVTEQPRGGLTGLLSAAGSTSADDAFVSDATTTRAPVIQVEGGSVLSALWADGASLTRSLGAVEGTVRERGTGRPLAGIVVRLVNTPYRTTSDVDGAFRISGVLPGLYALAAVDSQWEPFRLGRPVSATVRATLDRPASVKLEMDEHAKLTQQLCDLQQSAHGPSMVAGRAVDSLGNAMSAEISWRSDEGTAREPDITTQKTTTRGEFWACGFHPGSVTFTATDSQHHIGKLTVVLVDTVVNRIMITIPR